MTPNVCISRSKPSEKRGHFVRLIEVKLHIVMTDGSLQLSRRINDVTVNCFTSLLYKKNRFHVDVCLFVNTSQETSKCSKTTSDTLA